MNVGIEDREQCAVCGREAADGHWFCHFYPGGERVALCSPACAEAFLDLPAELRMGDGERRSEALEPSLAGTR